MSENKPKVKIVVPLVEIDDYAIECIKKIGKIDYDNWDLILITDKRIKESFEKTEIIVSGNLTIGAKRNLAIEKYKEDADFFAFIDSDAFPEKSWITEAIGKFIGEDLDPAAVGGPNLLPPDSGWREVCASNAISSPVISGFNSFYYKKEKSRHVDKLPTCNLIVKASVFDQVGLFNESLVTGEDKEFCQRIVENQNKILYSQDVIVYHHRRKLWMPFFKQRFVYGSGIVEKIGLGLNEDKAHLIIPPLTTLYFPAGFWISRVSDTGRLFFIITVLVLLIVFIFEAARNSKKIIHIPPTFFAILISFFMPGLGFYFRLIGGFDFKKLYRRR